MPDSSTHVVQTIIQWAVAGLTGIVGWIVTMVLRHETSISVIETKQAERHGEYKQRLDAIIAEQRDAREEHRQMREEQQDLRGELRALREALRLPHRPFPES